MLASLVCAPDVAAERVEGMVVSGPAEAAPRWRAPAFPEDRTARLSLDALDVAHIVRMEQRNAAGGRQPVQVGIARRVDADAAKPLPALRWQVQRGGGAVARLRIASPDAMALRLGLRAGGLPADAELRFAGSADPARVVAVVAAREAERLANAGLYWTPVTDGEAQLVEVFVPRAADAARVSLRVEQVSHLLADSRNSFRLAKIGESDACNVDVACRVGALGAPFVVAKNAVAHMVFVVGGASYICTGTLLNDTVATSNIPYFYSAAHCIGNQATASTLNTFWNYEATACGSGVSASTTQRSGGATLLYGNTATDALLLRLNDAAPPVAAFAGWDAGVVASSTDVTAIHHPSGDAKKVSLGRTTGSNASRVEAGWLSGTTEGGSSGSGLFVRGATSYHLVGGLYGGSASCASSGSLSNSSNRDWYSRFDKVYPSIKAWLAPAGGGGGGGTSNVAPVADFTFSASGRTVAFTDASTDSDGTIASRQWQFGDGASSSQEDPVRTFAADGTYSVKLTVTDDDGATHSRTRQVTISSGGGGGGGGGGGTALANGRAVTGLSGAAGAMKRYTIALPAGATQLVVATSGGSGDADLYVRRGAQPTTGAYDCRSFSTGSTETCTFASPAAGTWHVLVHGYASFSGVSLKATWQVPATAAPVLTVDDATVEEGDSGTRNLVFTVRLSRNAPSQVRFDVATVAGTATAGSDFVALSKANLAINKGSRTRQVAVAIRGDRTVEGEEAFRLQVSNVRNATVGDGSATGTIHDDDTPLATVRARHDFDGDGKSDVLWHHEGTRAQRRWPGARATAEVPMAALPGVAWRVVAVDDFDGDGMADAFLRNGVSGANAVWPGGDASAQRAAGRLADVRWQVAGSGDFDGDGEADLLWRHATTGQNTIWRSARSATQQVVARMAGTQWRVGGVADFDGDGRSDILWQHATLKGQVWRGGNNATRIALAAAPSASQVLAGVGDFDGDGTADLFWRDTLTGRNTLWPAARFGARRALGTLADVRWKVAAVGDYDGDGVDDVLWRHAANGKNVAWRSARSAVRQSVAREAGLKWVVFGGVPH